MKVAPKGHSKNAGEVAEAYVGNAGEVAEAYAGNAGNAGDPTRCLSVPRCAVGYKDKNNYPAMPSKTD